MHRCKLLLLLFLLFKGPVLGQDYSGQWEGRLLLNREGKKIALNTRFELIQSGAVVNGVLYSRGAEKGNVFGCDYIVQGVVEKFQLKLTILSVQRSVGLSTQDCYALDYVVLKTKDSLTTQGEWVWREEHPYNFVLTKTDPIISFSADEEITGYFRKRMSIYDSLGVILPSLERFWIRERQLIVNVPSVLLEIRSVDSLQADSVSIYMNEEQVVATRNVSRFPLRMRLNLPDSGDVELMFVNESKVRPVARIRVAVITEAKTEVHNLELTGTKNLLWLIEYKKEEP